MCVLEVRFRSSGTPKGNRALVKIHDDGLHISTAAYTASALMNDLLNTALEAHGGLDRWRRVSAVRLDASITGAIWFVKGKGDVLKDVSLVVETKRQRLKTEFPGGNKQTLFEPSRVAVLNSQGNEIAARDHPEQYMTAQAPETPWDDLDVTYFCGEALWTYLNVPFLFAEPGFVNEEISPVAAEGETWRRLRVTFPERVKSHTRTQIFCFGSDGRLRRHDYTVDVLNGAKGLNYAYDYVSADGIMVPTTRRVLGYEGDYQPIKEPVLVEIRMRELRLL